MLLVEARPLLAGVDEPQLGCTLFSSFLLLRLSFPKSPGTLFGSPATSPSMRREALSFAPPPHDRFAFLAALPEDAPALL
jgi:hypothetical protein